MKKVEEVEGREVLGEELRVEGGIKTPSFLKELRLVIACTHRKCKQIDIMEFGQNGFQLSGSFGQTRPQPNISSIYHKYATF